MPGCYENCPGPRRGAAGVHLDLELVDEHRSGGGVVHLHHQVRR
jgi:hypothetical protein